MVIFYSYVSLPEGNPPISSWVTLWKYKIACSNPAFLIRCFFPFERPFIDDDFPHLLQTFIENVHIEKRIFRMDLLICFLFHPPFLPDVPFINLHVFRGCGADDTQNRTCWFAPPASGAWAISSCALGDQGPFCSKHLDSSGGWLRNPAPVDRSVVNIPLFCLGFNMFQPSIWWFLGFRWPIHSMGVSINGESPKMDQNGWWKFSWKDLAMDVPSWLLRPPSGEMMIY